MNKNTRVITSKECPLFFNGVAMFSSIDKHGNLNIVIDEQQAKSSFLTYIDKNELQSAVASNECYYVKFEIVSILPYTVSALVLKNGKILVGRDRNGTFYPYTKNTLAREVYEHEGEFDISHRSKKIVHFYTEIEGVDVPDEYVNFAIVLDNSVIQGIYPYTQFTTKDMKTSYGIVNMITDDKRYLYNLDKYECVMDQNVDDVYLSTEDSTIYTVSSEHEYKGDVCNKYGMVSAFGKSLIEDDGDWLIDPNGRIDPKRSYGGNAASATILPIFVTTDDHVCIWYNGKYYKSYNGFEFVLYKDCYGLYIQLSNNIWCGYNGDIKIKNEKGGVDFTKGSSIVPYLTDPMPRNVLE